MRTRWMLAMLTVMALFATACGDSDDGDDAPTTSEAEEAAAAEETEDAAADDSDETTAPETSEPEELEVGGGDPGSEWCQLSRDVEAQFDLTDSDPFAIFTEEGLARVVDVLDQAVQVAPSEIRSDVATSRDAFVDLNDLLARYDYDLLAVPQEEVAVFEEAGVEEAADRIEQYNEEVCGIPADGGVDAAPGTGDDDSLGDGEVTIPSDLPPGAAEAFIESLTATLPITEEQAQCLAEALDLDSMIAGGNFDPNDPEFLDRVFASLGDCDISITDLTG